MVQSTNCIIILVPIPSLPKPPFLTALISCKRSCRFSPTHVQYTQTESNRLKAKTIRVSSRIKDFRLTGSPFSGTRLTGSQVANKCAGRWKILTNRLESTRFVFPEVDSTQRKSGRKVLQVCARDTIRHNKERITWTFLVLKASLMQH